MNFAHKSREVRKTPRIALTDEKKIEYMIADLPYQLDKLATKRGIYQKDMADALHITKQAYGARKRKRENGKPKDSYTFGDLIRLFKLLELSQDEISDFFKL